MAFAEAPAAKLERFGVTKKLREFVKRKRGPPVRGEVLDAARGERILRRKEMEGGAFWTFPQGKCVKK